MHLPLPLVFPQPFNDAPDAKGFVFEEVRDVYKSGEDWWVKALCSHEKYQSGELHLTLEQCKLSDTLDPVIEFLQDLGQKAKVASLKEVAKLESKPVEALFPDYQMRCLAAQHKNVTVRSVTVSLWDCTLDHNDRNNFSPMDCGKWTKEGNKYHGLICIQCLRPIGVAEKGSDTYFKVSGTSGRNCGPAFICKNLEQEKAICRVARCSRCHVNPDFHPSPLHP